MKLVIYQKPACTTCRQVHAALIERGVDFEAVDYYVDSIPKKRLLDLGGPSSGRCERTS
jgi:arsenate reductase